MLNSNVKKNKQFLF